MKNSNLRKIITTALATASFTVTAFLLNTSQADRDPAPSPEVKTPRLTANGIEYTVTPATTNALRAGDKPVFIVKAVNTTAQPARHDFSLAMESSSPKNLMSRTPMMPNQIWKNDQTVTLAPNETKTFTVTSTVALSTNQFISVLMLDSFGNNIPSPILTVASSFPNQTTQPQALNSVVLSESSPSRVVAINFTTK